jgi:hypothetical protein
VSKRAAIALALLLPALTAVQSCPEFRVEVLHPKQAALVDDSVVSAAGTFGIHFDVSTAEVRIDGVDVLAALGLVPPFAGAGGVVSVSGQLLVLSNFRFEQNVAGLPEDVWRVDLDVAGLDGGSHDFELRAFNTRAGVVRRHAISFAVVAPFTLEAELLAAAGQAAPQAAGSEGVLHAASFGQPFAAPPVGLSGGGELRQGFVEVSEARIAGGMP